VSTLYIKEIEYKLRISILNLFVNRYHQSSASNAIRNVKKKLIKTSFECKVCGGKFEQKDEFLAHMNTHTEINYCYICDKIFKSKEGLYMHNRLLHYWTLKYKCAKCERRFRIYNTMAKHKKNCEPSKTKIEHSTYKCWKCNRKFNRYENLQKHRELHSIFKYKCEFCPEKFKVHEEMLEHKLLCNERAEFEKNSLKNLKMANLKSVPSLKQIYKCSKCGKKFNSESYRDLHESRHLKTRS
jgi:DNA-directed RNA polymerase subunit RPC12/RpoP